MASLPKYVVIEKRVGETPLQAVEKYRLEHPELTGLPLAYAGRLDPMASGKLLVLVGDECKRQQEYHGLDKEYVFEVLLGSRSDTGDILGLIDWQESTDIEAAALCSIARGLRGPLSLPYPHFSSRTIKGKPLHIWTLENRLGEIEIPAAETIVYSLELINCRFEPVESVYQDALTRINSIPEVTEASKALGRDFRRSEVRVAWRVWLEHHQGQQVQIARFRCVASSGTYMRSLSEELGRRLGTVGLAYSIHRSRIGRYRRLPFGLGLWTKRFG